jgi:hypothetical protein
MVSTTNIRMLKNSALSSRPMPVGKMSMLTYRQEKARIKFSASGQEQR